MLYINDKEFEVLTQTIFVGEFTKNNDKGYNICMQLLFINVDNNEKGYINLDAGYEKDSDIRFFLNREYNGIPFDSNNNQFICFECFDTEKFLDTQIEGKIIIKLKDMKNDKIEASFEVNDELIKIKFDGYLDIDFEKTRDTFLSL